MLIVMSKSQNEAGYESVYNNYLTDDAIKARIDQFDDDGVYSDRDKPVHIVRAQLSTLSEVLSDSWAQYVDDRFEEVVESDKDYVAVSHWDAPSMLENELKNARYGGLWDSEDIDMDVLYQLITAVMSVTCPRDDADFVLPLPDDRTLD